MKRYITSYFSNLNSVTYMICFYYAYLFLLQWINFWYRFVPVLCFREISDSILGTRTHLPPKTYLPLKTHLHPKKHIYPPKHTYPQKRALLFWYIVIFLIHPLLLSKADLEEKAIPPGSPVKFRWHEQLFWAVGITFWNMNSNSGDVVCMKYWFIYSTSVAWWPSW